MLKKLLITLCFVSIASLSECMQKFSYYPISPSAPPIDAIEENQNHLLNTFSNLLVLKNAPEIQSFIEQNPGFIGDNLPLILRMIFEANLTSIIDHLKTNYIIDDSELIAYALEAKNITWVKEFTHFPDYVTNDTILNFEGYTHHLLNELQLKFDILKKIMNFDGINYQNRSGNRYLPSLIRWEDDLDTIKDFISKASPIELSAQEKDGSTALHEAAYYWERKEGAKAFTLIKELLKHGADQTIPNSHEVRPDELLFFKTYPRKCAKWSKAYTTSLRNATPNTDSYQNTADKLVKTKQPKTTKKRGLSMVTLAGATLMGVFAFYLGCKIYNKTSTNTHHIINLNEFSKY